MVFGYAFKQQREGEHSRCQLLATRNMRKSRPRGRGFRMCNILAYFDTIGSMERKILDHYLRCGTFTNPGEYRALFASLPDTVRGLSALVSHQIIHRITLQEGNTNANADKRYGDMDLFPWHRLRCDDDVLTTAVAMTAELLRLDARGFVPDRKVEHKLVVTCRYVAVLVASILKAKGVPCRVRSGFAPYFFDGSWDHWINQYWDASQNRWVTIDADGFFDLGFDQYDIPESKFDWAASTWLGIREGALDPDVFHNSCQSHGLEPVLWAVFDDFHSLMNNEILYLQLPSYVSRKFKTLSEEQFAEIDALARLMLDPDGNFDALVRLWETEKKFRILNGPLIGDSAHVRWK